MSNKTGTIEDAVIYSKELEEEIELLVYLPANFSPLYKYALLIAQDGKDYFQLGRIPRVADQLLEEEEIEDLIIVGVPYRNVEDRWEKYHPDGSKQGAYIRFLAHELVPFLEERYPLHNVSHGRGLAGDSLAATVSLIAALQYPHTFGKVIMHSPHVDDKVMNAVEQAEEYKHLSLYHVIGLEETEVVRTNGQVDDFLSPNRALHDLLYQKGFDMFYEEFEGGHSWKYWQPDLKRALSMIFE
ncbi:alpha/beta hydrolase [Bacillus thermotolerans]|uniref:Acetyl esterase YjcH n=1 Tax=Bacillus thermotolerans TaxID=1221996 RepID=A0A0F5I6E8_BACTR|nr:alpha/beta hydrolase-fold protein [Bacillus thermotolerans]KKB38085.1 putative acetyl esterase YjcH [Bacillus thermotolerans]KKB40747.1 putative acetyl esterase YjcH [Bacillus thermotolerans]KKB41665.1 putative acetyl esterase YjcH [Bacillus thermotolerans]